MIELIGLKCLIVSLCGNGFLSDGEQCDFNDATEPLGSCTSVCTCNEFTGWVRSSFQSFPPCLDLTIVRVFFHEDL
jgi:hypothetical protein